MKKVILAVFCLASVVTFAQNDTTYWTKSGLASLGYSQTGLTNWAGGGDNTFSINSILNYSIKYTKAKNSWDNSFEFAYGQVSSNKVMRKGDDKIDIASKYGHQASKKWYYSAMFSFKSQFDDGFDYGKADDGGDKLISTFMAPANIALTLGMDYKPTDKLSVLVSPLSARWITVFNDSLSAQGAFGVDPGKNVRQEFGAMMKLVYEHKEIVKNVGLKTKLELYSNYLDHPENVDVNWEVMLDLKVNKFLSATFSTDLRYDDNTQINGVNSLVQFKEILAIGLTYKF